MRLYTGSILAAERKCGIQFTLPQRCTLRSSTLCMVYAINTVSIVSRSRRIHDRHEIPSVYSKITKWILLVVRYHMEKRETCCCFIKGYENGSLSHILRSPSPHGFYDATDCSAFYALRNSNAFGIRPVGLLPHVLRSPVPWVL